MNKKEYKCKPCDPKDEDKSSDVCMVCDVSGTETKLKIVKNKGRQRIMRYKDQK